MNLLSIKARISDRLLQRSTSIRERLESLDTRLDDLEEVFDKLLSSTQVSSEDISHLLGFLAFLDESMASLSKMEGQVLFMLSTELLLKQQKKEIKSKIIDFVQNDETDRQ